MKIVIMKDTEGREHEVHPRIVQEKRDKGWSTVREEIVKPGTTGLASKTAGPGSRNRDRALPPTA